MQLFEGFEWRVNRLGPIPKTITGAPFRIAAWFSNVTSSPQYTGLELLEP